MMRVPSWTPYHLLDCHRFALKRRLKWYTLCVPSFQSRRFWQMMDSKTAEVKGRSLLLIKDIYWLILCSFMEYVLNDKKYGNWDKYSLGCWSHKIVTRFWVITHLETWEGIHCFFRLNVKEFCRNLLKVTALDSLNFLLCLSSCEIHHTKKELMSSLLFILRMFQVHVSVFDFMI